MTLTELDVYMFYVWCYDTMYVHIVILSFNIHFIIAVQLYISVYK